MVKVYPSLYIYSMFIMLSIVLVMSSNNWFMLWVGFEMSLLSFTPLFSMSMSTSESIIKYFLVQASGSGMFVMSFVMSQSALSMNILTLGMMMKLGLFPFFQWVPAVMLSLSWVGCLILVTIQKLSPFVVSILLIPSKNLVIFSVISTLVVSILGYNQTYLRPLMAYSSISHSSWIILLSTVQMKLSLVYIGVYFVSTMFLFFSFNISNMDKVNQSMVDEKENLNQNIILLILAGMPPFIIFLLKINTMFLFLSVPMVIIIMIFSTYITTYYYLSFILPKMVNSWVPLSVKPVLIMVINVAPVLTLF